MIKFCRKKQKKGGSKMSDLQERRYKEVTPEETVKRLKELLKKIVEKLHGMDKKQKGNMLILDIYQKKEEYIQK